MSLVQDFQTTYGTMKTRGKSSSDLKVANVAIKLPPWPVLGTEALHGLAGEVLRTIEPHSEADPIAILVQFLAAAGNIIGRRAYYQVESDRHHANIFAVLVGQSSKARK